MRRPLTLIEAIHETKRDHLHIVGDTRVSWAMEPAGQEGRSLHPRLDHAVLKIIVSRTRTRCLAYAGEVDPAGMQDLLVPFFDEVNPVDEEVQRLAAIAASGASDFLLAAAGPTRLWRINHGAAPVPPGVYAWIGENPAHERFREQLELATKARVHEQMEDALRDVIDSGAYSSVGGMVVRASTALDGRFSYFPTSTLHIGDGDRGGLGAGVLVARSISNGPFICSALKCADDYPAVAWWFVQSGSGFLSAPLMGTQPLRFEGRSPDEARAAAEAIAGRTMRMDQTFRARIIM